MLVTTYSLSISSPHVSRNTTDRKTVRTGDKIARTLIDIHSKLGISRAAQKAFLALAAGYLPEEPGILSAWL